MTSCGISKPGTEQKIRLSESLRETGKLGDRGRPPYYQTRTTASCHIGPDRPRLFLFDLVLLPRRSQRRRHLDTISYPVYTLLLVDNLLLNHKTLSFPSKTPPVHPSKTISLSEHNPSTSSLPMVNVILDDRYMDCPTEWCPRRIVKVLVCSGKQNLMHKGLPFRSVSDASRQLFYDC